VLPICLLKKNFIIQESRGKRNTNSFGAFISTHAHSQLILCVTMASLLFNTTMLLYMLYETRLKGKNRHSEYITLNCRKICKEIANATSRHIHHIRLNYEAYLKDLPSDKEIFVIRTKHLWQDWRTVNNLLGSPTEVPIPESVDEGQVVNSQKNLPVKSNLSSNGQRILCKLLLNEYKLYIDLINRAVNLSDDDLKTTLEDVQRNCPATFESILESKYIPANGGLQ